MIEINAETYYGSFKWCSNQKRYELTDIKLPQIKIIRIEITIPTSNNIDTVEIYDPDGGLLSRATITSFIRFYFKLENDKLVIQVGKKISGTILIKAPIQIIAIYNIEIPKLKSKDKCCKCYQYTEEHITSCGHYFHHYCLWNVIDSHNIYQYCQCNGKVISSFLCPYCEYRQFGF